MVHELTAGRIPYLIFPTLLVSSLALCVGLFLYQLSLSNTELIQQQLAKFDKLRSIASFKNIVPQNAEAPKADPLAELFFGAGTPAIVTAQLLTDLKNIAAAHGLEVLRAADIPTKTEGSLNLIGGTLDLSGSMTTCLR